MRPDDAPDRAPAAVDDPSTAGSRVLAAVLFTDIVGSTRLLAEIGNSAWRERLEAHDRALHQEVLRRGGRVLRSTGDGALCLFPDPGQAIEAALALHAAMPALGLRLRAGLHLGEIELREGQEIAGIAVHVAARIADLAPPGETLVSATVRSALIGTRFWFIGHGRQGLRGVPGRWSLYLAGSDPAWHRRRQRQQYLKWAGVGALLLLAVASAGLLVQRVGLEQLGSMAGVGAGPQAVAVLPFANLSSRAEDGYFAVGIQDEILTQLSKISALKVISRSSTRQYDSAPENLREVGRQLGVSHVLEGSVQRSGDQVRINVQLIRVADDSHAWAEVYDRPMADLLGVQAEVARAIARAMNAQLSEGERRSLAQRTTTKPEAYDAYLQGLAIISRGGWGEANMRAAIQDFEQAVALDPDFVQAWAQLAYARSQLHATYERTQGLREAARQAAETALKLEPDSFEARLAQAHYTYLAAVDIPEGRRLFEAIDRRDPGRAEVKAALAKIAQDQGRCDDALALFEQGLGLDPQNRELFWDYGFLLNALHRFDEAHRLLDRARRLFPDYAALISLHAYSYMAEGRLAEAEALLALPGEDSPDHERLWARLQLLDLQHRFEAQAELLRPLLAAEAFEPGFERAAFRGVLGRAERLAGQTAQSRTTLEMARQEAAAVVAGQSGGSYLDVILASIEAQLGLAADARGHLDHAQAFFQESGLLAAAMYQELRADVEVQLGDHASALARLKALRGRPTDLTLPLTAAALRLDPRWDPLRADPEFARLLD